MDRSQGKLPFHPVLSEWFARTFGEPTDVQSEAWQAIRSGNHTLIAAPTGSGKTLAALLPCLDRLANASTDESAPRGVRVLYVTPLKALNNDIHHHVVGFVEQLDSRAAERQADWPGIRCEVRTGDTPQSKRAAMLRHPPEVLITTPESLFLLLISDKGRAMLRTVEQVIVDEIHDLAASKRGAHLSLSLERLAHLCGRSPQRIGVSATQQPIERVAAFLGGWEEEDHSSPKPRPVAIVRSEMRKRMQIAVSMPDTSRSAATREGVWLPLLDRIMQAMEGCRSVLLFVNSRRLCERLCLRLNDHVGYEMARSHHGSISKERRLEVERMLKAGELRCIVATSSLELGIDVGHIDLVIQIDSPQEAARGIQRIGRAGHGVGEASRGLLIARQKTALPEIAVLSKLIASREIEDIRIPEQPLDVLSQHIVAAVASGDWQAGQLYRLIRGSDSYHRFPRTEFERALSVLAGFYPFVRPLVEWNRDTGVIGKRSNTLMAAVTGAGTIPQSGAYPVHHMDSRVHLGELDEEFIHESRVGDVFLLGTSAWMIREIGNDRVYVSEAGNRFSEVPFWRNESGSRSYEMGERIGAFIRETASRLGLSDDPAEYGENSSQDEAICDWLAAEYGLDRLSAESLVSVIRAQHHACGLPTDRTLVIEHYRDVMNQTHIILHNHCGRKVNRAWLLAIERQFEKLLPYRVYGNAKDNGIEFVLPEWDASWMQALYLVTPSNVEELLAEAITGSPLLAISFRRIAETSLLLSRGFTRTPMWQKRLRGEELLRNSLPYATEFPYLREAMAECLHDYLGLTELKQLLESLTEGRVQWIVRETPYPSPLAAQFLADYVNMRLYEGDGVDETIRLQLLNASKELAGQLFGAEAMQEAIGREALAEESRRMGEPDRKPNDADELADLMKRRGDLTAGELTNLAGDRTSTWLSELHQSGKAIPIEPTGDGEYRWIRSDEREVYARFPRDPSSLTFVLGRYARHVISFTEKELCERYPDLTPEEARRAVDAMLEHRMIERAPHAASDEERIWSSVDVASRIVRLSIKHARDRAEPVDPARWFGRIAFMQHALQGAQKQGSEGVRAVIERLQGLYLPLSLWETVVFPARVAPYRKDDLDLLCASGEVLWLGRKDAEEKEGKIAFFLTDSKPLYSPFLRQSSETNTNPSKHPELLRRLEEGGASFLTKLSREMDKPPTELLQDLLELVWEGRVSNDQFAPLRLQASTKHAKWARTGSGLGRWYATGSLAEPRTSKDTASSPLLSWAHHLLNVYGLINKELVARTAPFGWDELYPALKRLEEWGVLTRGTFIGGMSSLQFTTREMSEAVRLPVPELQQQGATVLSAADPANPYGWMIDWPKHVKHAAFARNAGNYILLQGDRWLYWIEGRGKKVFSMATEEGVESGLSTENQAVMLLHAFRTIIRRQKLVKMTIERWNGKPVMETELGQALVHQGAERQQQTIVVWSQ
ncbi:DEAD/DEAH box helicase [Cohnella panacarvi]|uniref:DEAD/DEAH box helicase n=1 Tax=Cohnella panacarvi TaxID=400776 RepID=UPI00047C27FB|nr:DEAD/DEAH box helicase [Cohnella panacarvi]